MMGIAYSRLLLSVLNLFFFRFAIGLVEMRTRDLLHMMLPPCLAAAMMLGVIMLSRTWVYEMFTLLAWRLGALIVAGVLAYGAGVLLMARAHVGDARRVLSMLLGSRGRP